MIITYKLFQSKKGALTERGPRRVKTDVVFSFVTKNENLTAIFKNESNETLYRPLKKSKCTVPFSFLDGELSVTVADLSNSIKEIWHCEKILCKKDEGGVWIMPAFSDVLSLIYELQCKIDLLEQELKKQNSEISNLKEAYEGYDVI